ncbi:MAG: metalloregulator ArsR/SmtB family transcription factor [Gemmataceae bacterium]|nr:metalloregulator ArsR/SmtB family transcription factor [Gemmataceae bacterium]
MIPFADAKAVAGLLAAVAEPTRVRVLLLLADRPRHVGELAGLLDIPMANMSHHLGVMRQAGLLDHDKRGRQVVYCLRPGLTAKPGPADRAVLCLGPYRLAVRREFGPPPAVAPRRASVRKARPSA